MNIILIGAQGSGKGTQSHLLSQRMGLAPCASGELLRTAIERETPVGKVARPYYERGDLVPDELVAEMILEKMREHDAGQGLILDGFPRNIAQAQLLDARLSARGERIDTAIYLEVPRELLFNRLSGRWICRAQGHVWNITSNPTRVPGICDLDGSELFQRADDTPDKITRRLDIFFNETIQLIDYYARQGKLIRVNGNDDIEHVNAAIQAGLDQSRVLSGSPDERSANS